MNFFKSCKCGKQHMARSPKFQQHAEAIKAGFEAWAAVKITEVQTQACYDQSEKNYYIDTDSIIGGFLTNGQYNDMAAGFSLAYDKRVAAIRSLGGK